MTPPAAAAASTAPAVRPRPPAAPRGPRRVSGPARRPATTRPARRTTGADAGLLFGLLSAVESVAQHRLFDRLIRGRAWIGLVAFALIGIVTLQLGLLKLSGGIGRALEHEALLQRTNAALSIENSELAAGTRVEARAGHLGMTFAPSGSLRFLSSNAHGEIAKAVAALSSAARAAAQSREASAAASESQSSEAAAGSEAEGESSEAGSTQATEESSSGEAQASPSSNSEEASTSESNASSGAAPASEAEASSAMSAEAEPSGGSSAGE